MDRDSTSSSSDESSSDKKSRITKEIHRRYAMYKEMLDNARRKQVQEKGESSRKRKAEEPSSDMPPEMQLEHYHEIIKDCFKEATEEANVEGYAYGIVLGDSNVLTGSSPSLRRLWEETVRFPQSGPAAADRFYAANRFSFDLIHNTEPKRTYDVLMKLSDGTLASILSALMQCCDPPQRKYPFEGKDLPPWWPKGNEPWWEETSIEKDKGEPPYRKPHDLKKFWKAAVVIAIIKHAAPNFEKLEHKVRQSKNLQARMSAREMDEWHSALIQEVKIYSRDHPDVPLSDLLRQLQGHQALLPGESSSATMPEATALQQQQQPQQAPQHQRQHQPNLLAEQRTLPEAQTERFTWPSQPGTLRFTCSNPRCLYSNKVFGFQTAALRDYHQRFCTSWNSADQFAAPVELPPFTPTVQLSSSAPVPPEQMVQLPSTSMLSPQRNSPQEIFRPSSEMGPPQQCWQFDAGFSNYRVIPSSTQGTGQMQPPSNEGSSSTNPKSFMQLLSDVESYTLPMPIQAAGSSIYQDLIENFNLGGGTGTSTGVFQPTGFRPFEPPEMHLHNEPAANPSGTLPQESHEVQLPSTSAVPNQFGTGNTEVGPGRRFFQ